MRRRRPVASRVPSRRNVASTRGPLNYVLKRFPRGSFAKYIKAGDISVRSGNNSGFGCVELERRRRTISSPLDFSRGFHLMGALMYYFSRWGKNFCSLLRKGRRPLDVFRVESTSRLRICRRIRVRWKTRVTLYRHSLGSALRENFWLRSHKARFFRRRRIPENFYCFRKDGEECRMERMITASKEKARERKKW